MLHNCLNKDFYTEFVKMSLVSKNIKSEKAFIRHIKGKIDFIGQVAKANKKYNKRHYKTRMNIYYNFMAQYKKLERYTGY